jgi:hypothetical protein
MRLSLVILSLSGTLSATAAGAQTTAFLTFHLVTAGVAAVPCGTAATSGVFVLSNSGIPAFKVPDKQELLITDVHGWMQAGTPSGGGVTFELRQEEPADWPTRRNVLDGYAAADVNSIEAFAVNVNSGAAVPCVVNGTSHLRPSICMLFGYIPKPGTAGTSPQLDGVGNVTVNGYLQSVP